MKKPSDGFAENGVAVVGLALKFPGADTVDEYWDNLVNGVDSVSTFDLDAVDSTVPDHLKRQKNYVPCLGVLNDIDKFDAPFFGFSPLEAQVLDPQHRIFLQLAWSALEDAGCVPNEFDGLIGVYAGCSTNTYFAHHVSPRADVMRRIGDYAATMLSEKDYIATRTSYCLNLKGPSMSINTACSTSLVAVSEAYHHLMTYQCDAAVSGAITVNTPQNIGYLWQEGSNFSKTGRCRPFDVDADGMVGGNGGAVIVLKRLEDAIESNDKIYAVIRGAALNNDGSQKIGFTASSIRGQVEVISMAQAEAEVAPETIGFIETHGTATKLGDQIEAEALRKVFRECREKSIVLGAVKGNLGHLDAAAGMAGLVKTILTLLHRRIPPTIPFKKFNTDLNMEGSPFWINTEAVDFSDSKGPRRAGVTSLGLGGTNAHIVLEEAPPRAKRTPEARSSRILTLSARSNTALSRAHSNLADHIEKHPHIDLNDIAYTLAAKRNSFSMRYAVISTDAKTTVRRLRDAAKVLEKQKAIALKEPTKVFVFPGQGVQYAGMGAQLYRAEPVFKEVVDNCSERLRPLLDVDLREILFCSEADMEIANEKLMQTAITQPAIFIIEYALAKLWQHYGVQPDAMIGHSIGQYAAACLSGVFNLDDCLSLVTARGRVIQQMERGIMLSVPLSASDLSARLPKGACIASVNAPALCVASGSESVIEELNKALQADGISSTVLRTSHAFHSDMMTAAASEFEEIAKKVTMNTPSIPFVCTATGTWITAEQATSPKHWAEQIRKAVLFSSGVETLLRNSSRVFIEVGPRKTMTSLIRQHSLGNDHVTIASMGRSEEDETDVFSAAIGQLWYNGCHLDNANQFSSENCELVRLPTYPFEEKSYWLSAVRSDYQQEKTPGDFTHIENSQSSTSDNSLSTSRSDFTPTQRFLGGLWQDLLGASELDLNDDFFDLGGHSLVGVQLLDKIKCRYQVSLQLADFLRNSTLGAMAAEIDSLLAQTGGSTEVVSTPKREWTPLVPLRPQTGDRAPLFCAAGIGGHVMELRQLADELGDIPLWGLETRGVMEGQTPHATIEELAEEHAAAIRTVQPHGPYFLSGYSIGGIVAFEIAKQLKSQNEKIAWLGLIDSGAPALRQRTQLELRIVQAKRFLEDPLLYVQNSIDRRRRDRAAVHHGRYAHIYAAMESAYDKYHPAAYNGDAVLFRTPRRENFEDMLWAVDNYNGWRAYISGKLEVIPITGRHLTAVQERKNAVFLAKEMKKSLLAHGI